MVGASRERVNKAIASFIRLGWLAQHDRRYKILQRDRLELRARRARRRRGYELAVEEGEAAPPGIGGVVGAVRRSVGVVHEAVLGVVAHDGHRWHRGQRVDVGRRRVRVAHADDRQHPRRARAGELVEGLALPGLFQRAGTRIIP